MTATPWIEPEDRPSNPLFQWPREDTDPAPLADWERELLEGDPYAAAARVVELDPPPAAVARRAKQPVTQVRHRVTGDLGTLVRMDHAGNPVVRWFGDHTEYPHSWAKIEIVASTEHEMVPGAFEIGLFVDGEGDLWRALGGCPEEPGTECVMGSSGHPEDAQPQCFGCGTDDPEPLFYRLVQVHGLPATSRSELSREDIVELTGALEPAGSPAAHRIREATSDTDGMALLAGLVVTLSVCVVILILVAVYRLITG
jgi:hypothetical protein